MSQPRPGPLLAIAIVGILLGLLGTCGGAFGAVTTLTHDALTDLQKSAYEGFPPEQRAAQEQLQETTRQVVSRYKPLLLSQAALNVLASIFLLVSCILLLRWHERALTLFTVAVLANPVIELVGAVIGLLQQREVQAALEDFAAAQDGAAAAMTEGIMRASSTVGVCFMTAWFLIKLGYYITAVIYVRRPATVQLFSPGPAEPAA